MYKRGRFENVTNTMPHIVHFVDSTTLQEDEIILIQLLPEVVCFITY